MDAFLMSNLDDQNIYIDTTREPIETVKAWQEWYKRNHPENYTQEPVNKTKEVKNVDYDKIEKEKRILTSEFSSLIAEFLVEGQLDANQFFSCLKEAVKQREVSENDRHQKVLDIAHLVHYKDWYNIPKI
jgi:hypothetical protein